eukprot:gene15054-17814_t
MVIVSLEIKNFKSYKGLHHIGPFKQFTCVIGPNGSGKSNLMEAIIFVLGYKSSQTRGTTLSDLVFSGGHLPTKDTPVTPKDNASLSYEEYQVRLEELDVHIECKNFFVFQGDVQTLASQNPRHITKLIEQISGSDKLKEEYEALLKKKTEAEDGVVQTYAKKKSISNEKAAIRSQLSEAKEFRKHMRDREHLAIKSVLLRLHFQRNRVTTLTKALATKNLEYDAVLGEEAANKTEREEASLKQAEEHKKLLQLEDQLDATRSSKEGTRPEALKSREEIKLLMERTSKITDQISRAEKDHSLQLANINQLRAELEETQRAFEALEDPLKTAAAGKKLDKAQIEQYNAIKLQAGKDTSDLRKRLDQLMREQNVATETHLVLKARQDDMTKMRSRLQSESDKLEARRESNEQQLRETDSRLKSLREEHAVRSKEEQDTRKETEKVRDELDRLQFLLADEKNERAGNDREKKINGAIASLRAMYPGQVYGKVSELCQPVQRKYSTALVVAMGKLMDAVVVEDERMAFRCVEYMKEHLLGVATFLPLDTLQAKQLNPQLRQLGGTARLLVDCIKYDKTYDTAVRYVFGNTLVCDTLPEAKKLAFGADRHKVVTVAGVKITKTGLMSGGGMAGLKSKVAKMDAPRLEDTKRQCEAAKKRLDELSARHMSFAELQAMATQINAEASKSSTIVATLVPIKERLTKYTDEMKSLDNEMGKVSTDLSKIAKSLGERKTGIDEITSDIHAVEEELFKEFIQELGIDSIKEFEDDRITKLQDAANERMAIYQKMSRLQNQVEYEESRNLVAQLTTLKKDLEVNEKSLEEKMVEQEGTKKVESQIDNKAKELNEKIKSLKELLYDLNSSIKDSKKKLSDIAFKKDQLENQIAVGLGELDKYKKEFHRTLMDAKTENMSVPLRGDREMRDRDDDDESEEEEEEDEEEEEEKEQDEMDEGEEGEEEEKKKKKKKQQQPKKKKKKESKKRKTTDAEPGDSDQELFQDSDEEELDSEDEQDEDTPNSFPEMVLMINDSMDTDQLDDFYDEHLKIPIDYSIVQDINITSEEKLQYQLKEYSHDLHKIKTAMETYNPNMKAYEQLKGVSTRLKDTIKDLNERRAEAKVAAEKFAGVRSERTNLFTKAFESGSADLALEDTTFPFNAGVKYTAIPPNKRYQDMEQLSGGEKSIAALALLFALHAYKPTPFFILDEVDAAFDNINVLKLVRYVRAKAAKKQIQFVVISLKEIFFNNSDGLVGVCREIDSTSKTLTCSLEHLAIREVELFPIREQQKFGKDVLSARKLKRESLMHDFTTATDTSATETSANETSDSD